MTFDFWHSHHDEEPIRIPALGLYLRVRLPDRASGNALTIMETTNFPGFGPPLHRHRETEVFHVLAGRYLFEVDGRRFFAETGDIISVPGGAAHAFVNVGDTPAQQLVLIVPGFDAVAFFTGLGSVMSGGAPDNATLSRFGASWGVEFLGPPIQPD